MNWKHQQATVLNKQKFYIVKPKQGEDFTLPKKWSSKTLGKTAIKALITKGETSKLKGFKSKKGKSFDAKLKLDGHKLSFDFDQNLPTALHVVSVGELVIQVYFSKTKK